MAHRPRTAPVTNVTVTCWESKADLHMPFLRKAKRRIKMKIKANWYEKQNRQVYVQIIFCYIGEIVPPHIDAKRFNLMHFRFKIV